MPNLSNQDCQLGQNFWTSSATPLVPIGTHARTQDGRCFVYVLNGAADTVAGNVLQSSAIVPNHLAMTAAITAASSVGSGVSQQLTITPGASTGTANQYGDGYLQIDTTPGNGYTYTVRDHLAISSSTAFLLNMYPDDPIQVALTASSRQGLLANKYRGVIQFPVTTATGTLVGVSPYIITAAQYGWVQTWGIASVLINGTPALGAAVVTPSATTAGSVDVITTTNLVTAQLVGYMAQVGVSTKNNFVDLKIAP